MLTSIQILKLCRVLQILTYVSEESRFATEDDLDTLCPKWDRLYLDILSEQRIWDLRNLISAMVSFAGPFAAPRRLLGRHVDDKRFTRTLLEDWTVPGQYDESTYLALLDIFVVLSGFPVTALRNVRKTSMFMARLEYIRQARFFAASIKANSPDLVKSRAYLRWILAEEELPTMISKENKVVPHIFGKGHHLRRFPGCVVARSPLLIYIPRGTENPGWDWVSSSAIGGSNDLLQTALEAAREFKDYQTEALCLQMLIMRSPSPEDLFSRLEHLQREVQGDITGYKRTCLSQYLLVTDDASRRALLEKIGLVDQQEHSSGGSLRVWGQYMIQKPLYRSLEKPGRASMISEAASSIKYSLPMDIQEQTSRVAFPNHFFERRQSTVPHRAPAPSENQLRNHGGHVNTSPFPDGDDAEDTVIRHPNWDAVSSKVPSVLLAEPYGPGRHTDLVPQRNAPPSRQPASNYRPRSLLDLDQGEDRKGTGGASGSDRASRPTERDVSKHIMGESVPESPEDHNVRESESPYSPDIPISDDHPSPPDTRRGKSNKRTENGETNGPRMVDIAPPCGPAGRRGDG